MGGLLTTTLACRDRSSDGWMGGWVGGVTLGKGVDEGGRIGQLKGEGLEGRGTLLAWVGGWVAG